MYEDKKYREILEEFLPPDEDRSFLYAPLFMHHFQLFYLKLSPDISNVLMYRDKLILNWKTHSRVFHYWSVASTCFDFELAWAAVQSSHSMNQLQVHRLTWLLWMEMAQASLRGSCWRLRWIPPPDLKTQRSGFSTSVTPHRKRTRGCPGGLEAAGRF